MKIPKDQHEEFARFFSEPSRENLRNLVKNTIGEADHLDFKEHWPDSPKLARHVLSVANSGGGAIVVGVAQNKEGKLEPCGLISLADKSSIAMQLQKFLPKPLKYFVLDFHYKSSDYGDLVGKSFQVLLIEDEPKELPFLSLSDGIDVRKNAIYVRFGTNSREADHDELQSIINRRVETGHSSQGRLTLKKHLEQLRALDESRQGNDSWLSEVLRQTASMADDKESSDFKEFLESAYEAKKALIHKELGVGL